SDLDAGRRYGEGAQLERLALLQLLDDRQRFLTRRVVVEDVGDLLAFEVPAQFVLDELDGRGALRPVGGGDREQVRIAGPVRRAGAVALHADQHLLLLRRGRAPQTDCRAQRERHYCGLCVAHCDSFYSAFLTAAATTSG